MLSGAGRGRAQLMNYATRESIEGATVVANDDWFWYLSIIDSELLGAKVYFRAKRHIDDPDGMVGNIELSSDEVTEIKVLSTGNPNRLDAEIRIPYTKTAVSFGFNEIDVTYYFDVQIVRDGTPVGSPKRQTYFREGNSYFKVTRDITINL